MINNLHYVGADISTASTILTIAVTKVMAQF